MPDPLSATRDDPSDDRDGADRSRPHVIAQLGQSLDGRIATVSGDSRGISGGAALDHLHRLRASVDAVVVGVGTVIADDPLLTVRRVLGRNPARVVVDPNGRLPDGAACRNTGDSPLYVVGGDDRAAVAGGEIIRIGRATRDAPLAPAAIVDALFAIGFARILIEGGATTISRFMDAGAVHRLHVMVAPMIIGSGVAGLSLSPIQKIAQARHPATRVHVLADGNVLFDCDLRNDRKGACDGERTQ